MVTSECGTFVSRAAQAQASAAACNGNNDNIHAGAKFDAGGGAETSFPLTVA